MTIDVKPFVEFAFKSGLPKMTLLRKLKNQPSYTPAQDYWKPLKDAVAEHHAGNNDPDLFSNVLLTLGDERKTENYTRTARAYQRWLARWAHQRVPPPRMFWNTEPLQIRACPELAFDSPEGLILVKLNFKIDRLPKSQADGWNEVLIAASQDAGIEISQVITLNVQRGEQITATASNLALRSLLRAEAASFASLYDQA